MSWYYYTDPEYCQGPYSTREEAIDEARHDLCGEGFYVAEGEPMKYRAPDFDRVSEMFDDANEEYSGEDYPSAKWEDEHYKELVAALTKTMDEWLDRHGYRAAWALDLKPEEWIEPEDSE